MLLLAGAGCRQDMHDTPRVEAYEATDAFPDGRGNRMPVEGTVARGHLNDDELLYTGKVDGQLVDEFPFPVTKAVLERGRERFNIYCSPCHGQTGMGNGMIVSRGLRPPPSYHDEKLRTQPVGHFFDVMTNGFGAMQDYRAQVDVTGSLGDCRLHPRAAVESACDASTTCQRTSVRSSMRRNRRTSQPSTRRRASTETYAGPSFSLGSF